MQDLLSNQLFVSAIEFIDIAAQISKEHFRKNFTINVKEGNYPVTAVDLKIEQEIRALIKKYYASHGIIGEEFASYGENNEYVWVLDPIDGTVAYTTGKPTYSTLIALLKDQKPILGIIDQPILSERYIGVSGQGSWLNGKKLKTSSCDSFKMARLNATTPYMFITESEKNAFAKLQKEVRVTSFGGDSYAYGLLASGYIDIIMEADLKYYDVASVIPIIEESGGLITTWQGHPITKDFKGQCLVTANKTLHNLVLDVINN